MRFPELQGTPPSMADIIQKVGPSTARRTGAPSTIPHCRCLLSVPIVDAQLRTAVGHPVMKVVPKTTCIPNDACASPLGAPSRPVPRHLSREKNAHRDVPTTPFGRARADGARLRNGLDALAGIQPARVGHECNQPSATGGEVSSRRHRPCRTCRRPSTGSRSRSRPTR